MGRGRETVPLGGRRKEDKEADTSGLTTTGEHRWQPSVLTSIPAGDAAEEAFGNADKLSLRHIVSAHRFGEIADEIEARNPTDLSIEDQWHHNASVSASVLLSAAFLEGSINELYLELQKLSQSEQPHLRRELALLLRAWPQIVKSPVLEKYQIALSVVDADQYNEGRAPFADADSLVRLRDALLSYTPEWDDRRGRHHTLEKRLSKKFPPNPLAPPEGRWFPDRCLSAGCARWAVRTVQLFSNDFFARMALPARPLVGGESPG